LDDPHSSRAPRQNVEVPLMRGLPAILLTIVLLVIAGAAVFLVTWDIPPPTAPVEKVIPNERFPR